MKNISQKITLRIADQNDWPKIVEIYNQAVDEIGKTADTEKQTVQSKKDWLSQHLTPRYIILLAEIDSQVVGWCSLSPHRPGRKALEKTAEISYYVGNHFRNFGVACVLITHAIKAGKKNGIKNLFAILLDVNLASVKILEKFSFEKWGHLPNIAEIEGKVCGQYIYGKHI